MNFGERKLRHLSLIKRNNTHALLFNDKPCACDGLPSSAAASYLGQSGGRCLINIISMMIS
jgi:hypothetical protein